MDAVAPFRARVAGVSDTAALVVVEGELDLATAPELAQVLEGLPQETVHLAVDLVLVSFVDSTGLALLTATAKRLRRRGGLCVLAVEDLGIRKTLELTGLDRYFERRGSASEAVARVLAAALGDARN